MMSHDPAKRSTSAGASASKDAATRLVANYHAVIADAARHVPLKQYTCSHTRAHPRTPAHPHTCTHTPQPRAVKSEEQFLCFLIFSGMAGRYALGVTNSLSLSLSLSLSRYALGVTNRDEAQAHPVADRYAMNI